MFWQRGFATRLWVFGAPFRLLGFHPAHRRGSRIYPSHYLAPVRYPDLLVQPQIHMAGYVPGAEERYLVVLSSGQFNQLLRVRRVGSFAIAPTSASIRRSTSYPRRPEHKPPMDRLT